MFMYNLHTHSGSEFFPSRIRKTGQIIGKTSVADPDPPDPHVFAPPGSGSGSTSQRYGPGSGSFYYHAKIVRKTLIPTFL
jgi:hypothetical protein